MRETPIRFLGQEDPLEKGQATHFSFLGLPSGSAGKESTCNVGDLGLIPGLGRSPGEGKGYPLQYSGLENFMDCIVHGVAKSQTQMRDFHFTSLVLKGQFFTQVIEHCYVEKAMAPHSSVLAWRIPETREPGGRPSMGSHRVGHD